MNELNSQSPETPDLIGGFLNRFEGLSGLLATMEIIFMVVLVLIVIEISWDLIKGNRRSLWEPLANITFQGVSMVLQRTILGLVVIAGFAWLEPYALLDIPHTAWSWVVCLIAADFSYYWMHRTEHRVRFFWALHSVHHSSEEYDLTTSLRIFWFIDLSIVFFFIPLVLIGFSGPQVLGCMMIVFTYMIWVHTEKIGKLGWLDKIVSTPSVHRVHHGANVQYLDKNYAGIFLIWDRMFGTYEPEVEKVRYGLTTPIQTSNPIKIGLHELIELWRDLRRRTSLRDRIKTLLLPPGWQPEEELAREQLKDS